MERSMRRAIVGIVASDKMDKSTIAEVKTSVKDPKYGKQLGKTAKSRAHNEEDIAGIGDEAKITETRPLSKTKNRGFAEIIEKAE